MQIASLFGVLGLEVDKSSFELGTRLLDGLKHGLEALAVFEGVKMLTEMVLHVSETADAAVKTAEKLGTTAEAVQELGYAASLSDVSMGTLSSSLTKLERRLDAVAQKGKGPAADALQRLKISASELAALPIDKKLERIADGFADLPANVSKVPLAIQLGLSPSMISMLKDGGDGIREMREEAQMLGLVVSNDTAHAFEAWNDDMTRVKGAVQGLKNDAVVALLPVLRELTTGLFAWIKANRELIKQRLEQIMRAVVTVVTSLARSIGILYGWFEKIVPIVREVVIAFSELMGTGTDVGDALTVAGLAVAGVWALANLPVILMIAGIAALILIANSLWRGFQGKDSILEDLYESFEDSLGQNGAMRVVGGLYAAFKAMFDFLENKYKWLIKIGQAIGHAFSAESTGERVIREKTLIDSLGLKRGTTEAHMFGVSDETGIDNVVTQADDTQTPDIDSTMQAPRIRRRGRRLPAAVPAPFVLPGIDPASAYGSAYSGFGNPVISPQMHLEINVAGNADKSTVQAIQDHVQNFWTEAMRDAAIGSGARGGKLP